MSTMTRRSESRSIRFDFQQALVAMGLRISLLLIAQRRGEISNARAAELAGELAVLNDRLAAINFDAPGYDADAVDVEIKAIRTEQARIGRIVRRARPAAPIAA